MVRKVAAEFIGTFILVFVAVGTAVFAIDASSGVGKVGVALAFGFVLVALVYAIGSASGCHINPAVTIGVFLSRRMDSGEVLPYLLAQFAGGILGALLIKVIVNSGVVDQTGALGTNAFDTAANPISLGGALLSEILLAAIFVLVVLLVTQDGGSHPAATGLAIGAALFIVHLVGINLTGTSVNPARSFGPALVEGGEALKQVWLFIVAPLIGGVLAAIVAPLLKNDDFSEVGGTRLN